MRRTFIVAFVVQSCTPEVPNTPPGEYVVARFDPSVVPAVVPTPNDLATNLTTGLLSVPIPKEASEADRWFYDWLNTLTGFPAATGATVTFTHALDPSTVTASSIRVLDLASNTPVDAKPTYADTADAAAPGQVSVAPPAGGWNPGHRYAVAVIGGVNGARGSKGQAVVGSATWAFLRNANKIVECPGDELSSPHCRLLTEVIPSAVTDNPALRLADQLGTAKRLETLRRKYKPAIDALVDSGVRREDVALLWSFKVDDSPSAVFDPTAGKIPMPNVLAIKQGKVSISADSNASPSAQEWTRLWVNTLNGFPPNTVARADVAQQELDPSTLNASSVRVLTMDGRPLMPSPRISWDATLKRIVITPAGNSWGAATTIHVALIGGASGIKALSGTTLVASQVWALVRSAAPLVDCAVLGPNCQSYVKAAPITTNQAIALESLRRTHRPLLDQLEAQGVSRRDVAAAWLFPTFDQPTVVFDPSAGPAQGPSPSNGSLDPTTGRLNLSLPANASPAYAEYISDYLNTLDGFPVSTPATAEFDGTIDPSSVSANTVRVQVLSGPALLGTPTISFANGKLTVRAPGDSWGKGRTISVAVLGGPAGVHSISGKPLTASYAFSFLRLTNSLVDSACTTVGPSCRSVTALTDAEAITLEPMRRSLRPALDALEATGIQREDVAGAWVFRTVSQPELTFEVSSAVPFPNNHLFRGNTLPDGGTQQGWVLVLSDGGTPGDDDVPGVSLSLPVPAGANSAQSDLLSGLNRVDGFSTTAPIVSENSLQLAALDFGTIDAGSLAAAGMVKVSQADAGTGAPRIRVCLNCTSSLTDAGRLEQPEQLQWLPETPLEESSRYAAYVTTSVTDTTGKPVIASPQFALLRLKNSLLVGNGSALPSLTDAQAAQLEPIRLRMKGCLDRLEATGKVRSTLALAFCFTTQSMTAPGRTIATQLATSTLPTTVLWAAQTGATVKPALTTAGIPNSNIGAVVEMELTLPWVLTGPAGTLSTASSTWETRSTLATLVLPARSPPPTGFPVVVFAHGLHRSRADVLLVADALAASGLAVIGIDAPLHGERSDCRLAPNPDAACSDSVTQQCSASTGRCVTRTPNTAPMCTTGATCFTLGFGRCVSGACEGGSFAANGAVFGSSATPRISGTGFLDMNNLFKMRDSIRQMGAADFSQLERVLRASGPNTLDAFLTASALGRLDATQLHFLGHDVGAFGGSIYSAASHTPLRLEFNAAGSDWVGLVLGSAAFSEQRAAFISRYGPPGSAAFDESVVLARTVWDPVDPRNFLVAGLDVNSAQRRVHVSFIERDDAMPNDGTFKLLRAGLRAAYSTRLGWFEFTAHSGTRATGQFPQAWPVEARHGFLFGPPVSSSINPECDASSGSFDAQTCATGVVQRQVAQFLASGTTPANLPVTP